MKMQRRLTTGILFFLVVFIFLFRLFSSSTVSLDFGDDALTVSGPEEYSVSAAYDAIAALELVELTDAGEVVSGGENRSCAWGGRANESWGVYSLCVVKKLNTAVLVTTAQGERLVFNYESDDTTEAIYQMFTELLASRRSASEGSFEGR